MRWLCALAFLALAPVGAGAQDAGAEPTTQTVLVLDTSRLFAESAYALQLREEVETLARDLNAENERIVAELVEEERSLTERRPTMTPEAFRAEAEAFDEKAQEIRNARDAKEIELEQARVNVRVRFTEEIRPIVGQMMVERGASVVLDSRTVFVTVRSADITDQAISRIDAALLAPAQDDPSEADD
ncbi:periplasmic chaperone for outer membrane proteins Skp [Cognatiyoonia koreensis]|uniref:Periplasmic chaperone for outer membrane proteins Skp n=1 Tax=Cognatiyoonia koreensis TaxID=364200 RepID=A0A1I0P1G7_9RHOB|nr:OmpH family outer membrane protein [Cognatiyoonia koreensis]SEW07992.1 periplasmic chaperone for outer membrane proteins Skp [Cognatiyoonia koreensis]